MCEKAGDLTIRLYPYFMVLFPSVAILGPGPLGSEVYSPWMAFLDTCSGLTWAALGPLRTDKISPETQFQGLNLSPAWSWREIFYSEVQMQKTGKQMAKEKMDIP